MATVTKDILEKIMSLVTAAAEAARYDAGMGGRYDDGGASRLDDQVKFFRYGLNAQLPPEWEKYKTTLDPEYNEYIRLQKKFGKL